MGVGAAGAEEVEDGAGSAWTEPRVAMARTISLLMLNMITDYVLKEMRKVGKK